MTLSTNTPSPADPTPPDSDEASASVQRILARGSCPACSGGLVAGSAPVLEGHRHIYVECILGHRWTLPRICGGVFLVGRVPDRLLRDECARCNLPVAVEGASTHRRGDVEITTIRRVCFAGHHYHTPRSVGALI